MSKENWQDSITKEFPYLYRGRKLSIRQSNMIFGFECGIGWKNILRTLSIALMYEIKKADKLWRIRPYLSLFTDAWNTVMYFQPEWIKKNNVFGKYPRFIIHIFSGFAASQVKEKYGTLRYYMGFQNTAMSNHIDIAERASEHTCEKCGEWGKIRGDSWSYVACDEHTHENDKDKSEEVV